VKATAAAIGIALVGLVVVGCGSGNDVATVPTGTGRVGMSSSATATLISADGAVAMKGPDDLRFDGMAPSRWDGSEPENTIPIGTSQTLYMFSTGALDPNRRALDVIVLDADVFATPDSTVRGYEAVVLVAGKPATLFRDLSEPWELVRWRTDDGRGVTLSARNLDTEELLAAAQSLKLGRATSETLGAGK